MTVISLTRVNLYQGKAPNGVNLNQEMTLPAVNSLKMSVLSKKHLPPKMTKRQSRSAE